MLSLGPLAFAAPWLLLGLAALPALWWLLRVTPPAPKRVVFPALRLLRGLNPAEETPAKTPLWLLLLRLALAACVILALAQPLLNPRVPLAAGGKLVIAVDNGWSSARHWDEMRASLDDLIGRALRAGSDIVLLETAKNPGSGAAPDLSLLRPEDAHAAAEALQPRPWPEDRVAALARLNRLNPDGVAEIVWLSDGIDNGDAKDFAAGLQKFGPLRVRSESGNDLPRLLAPADPEDKDLTAMVTRADPALPENLTV
ncbi:MAG TPA: BatA domain-containing protein, partial [Stellaceae bacterium]|nr:BatA domain-containing protein [Stellaceae bacterium]